ncbi:MULTISPECIES: hypothetical protein [unclassified Aminobacter]|uniref:hypothetical protein n=1 Tax=unclassified Aminobacter TaxID=2644704 RepID=UPI0004662C72|nr:MULTISPECIES: hypothetical protein [unclassified Aminobacter]TWG64996.1 hypothetical protein L610_001500000640 [Aminobacter sp. J44]TWH31909.1 hypothetical protein L611_002300000640 [Aminobacter sp. J15]
MLFQIPLMIVPFIVYNLGLIGVFGDIPDPWKSEVFSLGMLSGGVWSMTLADMLVLLALLLLFVEIVKATRTSNASVLDHLLSTFVFIAFLVEFLLVQRATSSLFFILMTIAFVDVLAGFVVSLRASSRDINLR